MPGETETAAPVTPVEAPVSEAPSTEPTPALDPYETEIGLLDVEPESVTATAEPKAEEPQAQTAQAQALPGALTDGEKQIFSRAGLPDKFTDGWDRARIDTLVQHLAKSQAEQDKLGAELGRLKAGTPEPKKDEKPAVPQSPRSQRSEKIAALQAWAKENIADEMAEAFGLMQELDAENAQLRELGNRGPLNQAAEELVQDLVLELGFSRLEKDFPSVSKPETRKLVEDRFWLEWNTGAYSKPGVSLQSQIREALSSAARVTLSPNITESSAAASLIEKNKLRIASQPRTGPQGNRPKPRTEDDIYAEAYEEIMGER